jgi:aspartokinase-like uncharacterized kinase
MTVEKTLTTLVVKVGGSLFDMPALAANLRAWLLSLPTTQVILVPGGGASADVVRGLDRCHRLGEERAHWLALAALRLNACFMAAILGSARVVADFDGCKRCWINRLHAILDAHQFALQDEQKVGALPHLWSVTSDSLAARVAHALGAHQLFLLKSVTIPSDISWKEASERGFVDAFFAQAAKGLSVCAVNFRDWLPG